VLLVAVPLAMAMGLKQPEAAGQKSEVRSQKSEIAMGGKTWSLDPSKYLINVPMDFSKAFVTPNFQALKMTNWIVWKWVAMFAIIASLESLLSAKAVDVLDPQKRKTDLNRDLFACGVANLISSSVGGLPMISEIVRSRANVDNGAQTRMANLFHGLCLLLFVSFLPWMVNMIPVAALSAMLVFTGFRLAHPREFVHMYNIGLEQFIVFVTTIVAIVCTDLLVGALIGLAVELAINVLNGLPITSIFSAATQVQEQAGGYVLRPQQAAVFSNWLSLRSKIEKLGLQECKNIVVDLSRSRLVDHTVMEKLHEMEREFRLANLELKVIGLEKHAAFSPHPAAARKLPDHAMAA
jgi:MFS superfamily sulfate permease-like transporter